jgi:hypothetical protein
VGGTSGTRLWGLAQVGGEQPVTPEERVSYCFYYSFYSFIYLGTSGTSKSIVAMDL